MARGIGRVPLQAPGASLVRQCWRRQQGADIVPRCRLPLHCSDAFPSLGALKDLPCNPPLLPGLAHSCQLVKLQCPLKKVASLAASAPRSSTLASPCFGLSTIRLPFLQGELATMVDAEEQQGGSSGTRFTKDELQKLFTLRQDTLCDTRDLLLSREQLAAGSSVSEAAAWQLSGADVQDEPLQAAMRAADISYVHAMCQNVGLSP